MLEQFAKALAQIIFKKENQQFLEAQTEIKKTFDDLLGINYVLIQNISFDNLLNLFINNKTLEVEKCMIAAELLKEQAEILERAISSTRSNKGDLI